MNKSFIRKWKKPLELAILFISLLLVSACFPIHGCVKGTIIDKETRLPIEDVVIVRSWTRVYATVAGQNTSPLGFAETSTDSDGKFSFPLKISPCISIPVFSEINENGLIAYKPGYKFVILDKRTRDIEMEKVPATYFPRREEVEKARDNYVRDYSTNLYNELLDIDDKFIRVLPRQTGVYANEKNKIHLKEKVLVRLMPGVSPLKIMTMPPLSPDASSLNRRGSVLDRESRAWNKLRESGAKFDQLRAAMKDTDTSVRSAAARVLGESQDPKARKLLTIGLTDPNIRVRQFTAEAAGKMHAVETARVLRALLSDKKEHVYVRRNAAWALGEIKDIESVPSLIAIMKEEMPVADKMYNMFNSYFKSAIVEALGKIGAPQSFDPIVQALKNDNIDVRKQAVIALAEMNDKRAVKHLLEAFNKNYYSEERSTPPKNGDVFHRSAGNFSFIMELINAFAKLNDPDFVLPLTAALSDNNEHIRKSALKALMGFRDERAIKPLISVLGDNDPEISGNAAQALVMIGTPSVEAVLEELSSKSRTARMRVAYILGESRDERAILPLIRSLRDIDGLVRHEAAKAFIKIRDERAIPDLIYCLKDKQREVREAASDALINIGAASVPPLIKALHEKDVNFRIYVIDSLADIGHAAAGELIAALKDKDLIVRWIAARLLENIGDEAGDEFLDAVGNGDPDIRWRVAEVMGNIGSAKTTGGLIKLLNDKMAIVRWKAAEALGKIRDSRALGPLSIETKDSNPIVRQSATWSLSAIQKALNER